MALTVSSNGGNGLADLLRQARQTKLSDETAVASDQPANAVLRSGNRSGFDSTGSGTAQASAALTVYLSRLGGADEADAPEAAPSTTAPRSSAAELLRVLDAYDLDGGFGRLSA